MKTADLIPLILLELNSGDKYGLEITKAIESKSNNAIIIKQPTLYTILKKLEKSKFISSYWEDSEIGGKRHYYKITNNGKLQVSTLPPFSVLIANILTDENASSETEQEAIKTDYTPNNSVTEPIIEHNLNRNAENESNEKFSIMDLIAEDNSSNNEPSINVLPTEEVFINTPDVDTSTEYEINKSNSKFLKDEKSKNNEEFAENEEVAKFTTNATLSEEYKDQLKTIYENNIQNLPERQMANVDYNYDNVQYEDYENIVNNAEYKYAKKMSKRLILQSVYASIYMVTMLALSFYISSLTATSPIFYAFISLGFIYAIFYPTVRIFKHEKTKLKLEQTPLNISIKKHVIITVSVFVAILITCLIVGLCVVKSANGVIWGKYSFANLYAPMLISSTLIVDLFLTCFIVNKK